MKPILLSIVFAFIACHLRAQSDSLQPAIKQDHIKQKVHGQLLDAESKQPLAGVVIVLLSNTNINTITDDNGYFTMQEVPVGRQSFQFTSIGYEPYVVTEAMVISGKELELNVQLRENIHQLKEVTVSANKDKARPLNEFASVSARSFSVEETRRYAASFADPARMVQNFPGVSNAGDMDNAIVVRGNSPKGVLWKMEGIEIPNPNHFSSLGATGGAISMLNANTLGNSDFYTGAFAPEIGNALSGVFDLNLRNGNTNNYEHTIQVGTLGAEISSEGPFKKGGKSSYLFNYRYSTLAVLGKFLDFGTMVPEYQDASFKIYLPTEKAGSFSLFGLGGYNKASFDAVKDSTKWNDDDNNVSFDNRGGMGVAGISHQIFVKKDAYIKTVVSASYDKNTASADTLSAANDYQRTPIEKDLITNTAYRATVMYNQKLDARNTYRVGLIAQQISYDLGQQYYDSPEKVWKNILDGNGSTQLYQGYIQWKTRLNDQLSVVGGLHGTLFALNNKYAIEPRMAVTYQPGISKYTVAAGLHSKPEHISTYLFQNATLNDAITYPNKGLGLTKSFHLVGGYETALPGKLRLKAEAYYQHLYNVPVESDSTSGFSMINALDIYSLLDTKKPLVSQGTGNNYGIDISLEKPLSQGYYVLVTGSVFHATYTTYSGATFNSRFDRGYQANLIGGKEFKLMQSGRKIIGLNGKVLISGGTKETPIDLAASRTAGKTVSVPGSYFTHQAPMYFRADASIYYKINNRKATHTILLDVQNIMNRENYYFSYYDKGEIKKVNQLGILPNLSYRIDFHW